MIKVDRPFFLKANCSIRYSGRAESQLVQGDYLIIRKGDGTLMIHGATRLVALNYQPPGAIMKLKGNKLISHRKGETIEITVYHIEQYLEITTWSDNRISIKKTEDDLRNHIVEHIEHYLGQKISETIKEFQTPNGAVDILAVGLSQYHAIEVKRAKTTIQSCSQILRYLDYFKEIEQPTQGWIMSPQITQGAISYCQKKHLNWVEVKHESDVSNDSTDLKILEDHV